MKTHKWSKASEKISNVISQQGKASQNHDEIRPRTPTRINVIKTQKTAPVLASMRTKCSTRPCRWECKCHAFGKWPGGPSQCDIWSAHHTVVPLLGLRPREWEARDHTGSYTLMHTAELFTRAKKGKPTCPSTDEQTDKTWSVLQWSTGQS